MSFSRIFKAYDHNEELVNTVVVEEIQDYQNWRVAFQGNLNCHNLIRVEITSIDPLVKPETLYAQREDRSEPIGPAVHEGEIEHDSDAWD